MIEMLGMLALPFLACMVFGVALSYFGFQVLKREIIFVDIALAQVAAVGSLVAHLAFDAEEESLLAYALSFAFIALVALFYAVTRKHIVQISTEAVIGLSYAITAAAAMFLIGVATGHHIHAEEMLAGKLLWVTWPHLIASIVVAIIVFALVLLFRKPFHEISADYDHAVAQGRKVVWWDFLFYILLGALITLFVPVAGVVVVFALLVLPATTAVLIAQSVRTQMFVAWIVLAIGSAAGFAFSYRFDFSVGPPVALFLGVMLATVALVLRLSNLKNEAESTC